MIDVDFYLKNEQERVNRALTELLPPAGHPAVIYEAMRYSVQAGGKRLRPLLVLAVAKTLGVEAERVIEVACAVEFIHTYSLIHDDLPAMDNSDLRRGKPSCHRQFNEAIAILAGDALLTLAFEVLARYGLKNQREREALQIAAELARAAGVDGMIGGQVLDLAAEGSCLTAEELEMMNSKKTGALLQAAVRCGALAAGAKPAELSALSAYAARLGLAFQIVDDLLDREGTAQELGKPSGSDRASAKATFPALFGNEAAKKKAEALYREAVGFLQELGRPAELLQMLAARLIYRKS